VRITRFPSINENQFFGCVSAFVDSLFGELNAATASLKRLAGKSKGAAFAYEMQLDHHRYGAMIVLDRWDTLIGTFRPHLLLSRRDTILTDGSARVTGAETVLGTANQLIDSAETYSDAVVEACQLAFQSLQTTFREEQAEATQTAKLGPLLPPEYQEARRIFLEDLAAR